MTYTDQLRKQQDRDAAATLAQANADAWRQILVDYPDVLDGQANFQIVLEFCEGVITPEKFRMLYTQRPEGYGLALAQRVNGQVLDDRPKLIERIMKVIDPKGRRFSESLQAKMTRRVAVGPLDYANEERRLTYLNEENRLGYLTRVQLIDELERKNLNAELRSLSPGEVAQRRDSFRPKQEPPRKDGYPRLPSHLVLRGQVTATEMSPEKLRELAAGRRPGDYDEWRRLVKLYGSAQINERMQG